MKKKLLPISLLILLGMIATACGGGNGRGSSSVAPEDSSSAQISSSGQGASSSQATPSSSSVTPAPSSSSQAPAQSSSSQKPSSSSQAPAQSSSSQKPSSSSQAPSSSSQAPSSSSQAPNPDPTGVSLDKQSASIVKGQTLTLTATVSPENANNKEIVWSSSDEDVVTVKNGVVKAEEVGYAKVTAKIKGTTIKAECEISVIKEINSISITNKTAFADFIEDDIETLNIAVDPEDNVSLLITAGVLKVTSSNPEVATVSGLTISAVKAGKTTITASLFGKEDSFELTVGEAIPGVPYTIANAFDKAIVEAPFNGQSGNKSAISTTCFELTGKILAVAPNGATGYNAILDDGTQAVYLQVNKAENDPIGVAVGDYAKVTCKFTNYYGLLEGVSRKAETGKSASWIPSKDVVKIDAPATPITPTLNAPVTMSGTEYNAYYDLCKTNGTKDAAGATWTAMKFVNIEGTYNEAYVSADKGKYQISDKYGLAPIGDFKLDEPFEGQKSTLTAFLIGANTGKGKSNAIVVGQTPLAPTAVVFNQESDTVVVHGKTLQMTYTTTPAGSYSRTVQWSSSDETAATIDSNGVVTGIYEGTGFKPATIKVKLAEGVEATVNLKIFGEEAPATAVELNKPSLSLVEGQSETLVATVTPAMVSDVAVWTSSDPEVASVDQNGKVTALKDGNAVITVKLNDTVSARCSVAVAKLTAATNYVGAKINAVGKLMAVNGKKAIIDDGTGAFYAFAKANVTASVGDIVSVSGVTENYNGGLEINNATVAAATGTITPTEARAITSEEVATMIANRKADNSYAVNVEKVSLRTGVIGGSGQYLTWEYGDALMETSISTGNMQVGKMYDIEGYTLNFYKSGEKLYLCIVVTKAEQVELTPTGISLNKETLSLEEGQSETLKTTIAPEGATATITWTSSDESVATVDQNGKVTAVKAGNTTIKAAISESLYAECAVTVSEAGGGGEVPVGPVTVSKTVAELKDDNGWENGGVVNSVTIGKVDFTFTGDSGDTKYYDSGNNLRIYLKANGSGSVALAAQEGYKINSVTFTYVWNKNTGTFPLASGVADTINDTSKTYAIGNPVTTTEQLRITAISVTYEAVGSVTPATQPVGGFHGLAKTAAGTFIPVDMTLAADSVALSINGEAAAVTSYEWDGVANTISIVTEGAYGTVSASFADNIFTITGLTGAAVSQLDLTYVVKLSGNCQFIDCSVMTLDEMNATFIRRYDRNDNNGWQVNKPSDGRISVATQEGRTGLQCNGFSTGKVGFTLKNDLPQPISGEVIKSVGCWIYNPGETSFQMKLFAYKSANRGTNAELNTFTIQPGWHFYQTGVVNGSNFKTTDSFYNFQFYYEYVSVNPVFDDLCIYM